MAMADAEVSHSKPCINYLYKVSLVTLFLLLLALLPSIAPVHARSWELLQLIFVGIAVSYGLFSKRNDEQHGGSKLDDAQSYLTHKLHQVSSVFDDESESQTVIEETNMSKVKTLNSKYCRGEAPVLVVAKQGMNGGRGISQKPLLLPVRSLKQRIVADEARNVEAQKSDGNLVEKDTVLCSPIPWRSRSPRAEMKEGAFGGGLALMEEPDFDWIDDESTTTFSSEPQAKSSEDHGVVRKKKIYFSSSPPPAPPPPPPAHQYFRKSVLSKSNSSYHKKSPGKKVLMKPSVGVKELSENETEEEDLHLMRGGIRHDGLVKSVRTYSPNDLVGAEKKSVDHKTTNLFVEKKATNGEFADELFPKGETLVEKVMMETSDEDSDDDYVKGCSSNGEAKTDDNNNTSINDVGPDVDKKADEFIAKFREQIRLQRIETIRKSTAQRAGKSLR